MPSGWTMEGSGGYGDGDRVRIEDYLLPTKMTSRASARALKYCAFRCPSPPLSSWELRMVKDRKLKSLPPKPPDPHEQLLQDIRAQPKLKPVKDGRLVEKNSKLNGRETEEGENVDLETSRTKLSNEDSPPPARKVIKPDFNLLLSSSFEESEDDSEIDSPEKVGARHHSRRYSPLTSPAKDNMNATWFTGAAAGSGVEARSNKLQRRHTIMVCESPTDGKLAILQELPPLEEEEEPSPSEEPRLQMGSDSPLSGLPDHTLHNGHVMLRPGGSARHQGALHRMEHRRSLTSGLTAIPEDEDTGDGAGGGGSDSMPPNRRHSMPAAPPQLHGVGGSHPSAGVARLGEGRVVPAGGGGGGGGGCDRDSGCGSREHCTPSPDKHRPRDRCSSNTAAAPRPISAGDVGVKVKQEVMAGDVEVPELSPLSASEMMHVSWKTECQRRATNSASPCQDCRPVPRRQTGAGRPKRWQNPIECLSLTLEEVTHIRSVLTKAELESLISHSALHTLIAKNKVCFTCKTTRFTLFGEWGTKCKFCKRTICSKCMRKMHVPTEHFKNIPVYTLSPTPLTKEAQALIQNYVKSSAQPDSASPSSPSPPRAIKGKASLLDQQKGKRPLQRSQSMTLPTKKHADHSGSESGSGSADSQSSPTARGPLMNICCDCKGMIMEIIRASKTSLAMLQPGSPQSPLSSPSSSC